MVRALVWKYELVRQVCPELSERYVHEYLVCCLHSQIFWGFKFVKEGKKSSIEVGKRVLRCTLQGNGCKPAQCWAPEPTRQVRDVNTQRHSPAVVLGLGRDAGGQAVV